MKLWEQQRSADRTRTTENERATQKSKELRIHIKSRY